MSPTINTENTQLSFSLKAFAAMMLSVITICISGVLWTVNLQYGIYKRLDKGITITEFLTWQRELGIQNPVLKIPNMAEHHFGDHTKEDRNGIANSR